MKFAKWLILVGCAGCLCACEDDDKRDDTVLEMSLLVGKDWYYNAWLGECTYGQQGGLEVLRFEKNGFLKETDFGGRREITVGKWEKEGNKLTLNYTDQDPVIWNVLHSGTDYIRTMVNAQGERSYTTNAEWLKELTADAFIVNEYTLGDQLVSRIGAEVRGNNNLREGSLILPEKTIPLVNRGYYWTERSAVQGDYIRLDGTGKEVYFCLRIGQSSRLKLKDYLYADQVPVRTPAEMALTVNNQEGSTLPVSWIPYSQSNIYYRVEIFSQNMDLNNPYFVSRIQPSLSTEIKITPKAGGEVNRMAELQAGKSYTVRLTAILYEPDIDVVNDNYNYANIQAVTYFTKSFVWE